MRRLSAAAVVVALVLAVESPSAARRGNPLRIRLDARERTVNQGASFLFTASLTNRSPLPRLFRVNLDVERPGVPTSRISFDRWSGVLDGHQTIRLTREVSTARWYPQRGAFVITAWNEYVTRMLAFRVIRPSFRLPKFRDVTVASGLETVHAPTPGLDCNYAAGAAWGDVEGDGDLDLFLPNQTAASRMWINDGGTFIDQAAERDVDNDGAVGLGSVFADYDNDGDPDLYVANDGPNRLYRNDGSGNFEDVAPEAGVADDGPGAGASWADYDDDGNLDLYVTNYGRCGEGIVTEYFEDRLYHNEGDGTFTDVTELLHATGPTRGAGFQAAWFDYDRDGDEDLYLANDFVGSSPTPNVLWRNDGPDGDSWRFTNVSGASGAGVSINSMGIGLGDFERDGDLDIALSNIDASLLLRNHGDATFSDAAAEAGMDRPRVRNSYRAVTWGLGFHDFNLDGWEDVFEAGGSVVRATNDPQPDALFIQRRGGAFLDVSGASRADDEGIGRGVAFADYDRDGRMDIYVVNRGGTPRLLQNVTPLGRKAHWLEIDPVGTTSNRDGCGAMVAVRIARRGPELIRQMLCGSFSLASGHDPALHFGLGSARRVRRITIEWPSGTVQTLRGVRADRLMTITEPT